MRKGKKTVNDYMLSREVKPTPSPIPIITGTGVVNAEYSNMAKKQEEEHKAILEYNSNITKLDPDYTSVKPINGILVRLYAKKYREDGGLLINILEKIPVKASNGLGIKSMVNNPFPISNKAIIVSTPLINHYPELKPGVNLLLNEIPVTCPIPGDEKVYPKGAFIIDQDKFIPTEVTDKDFGYFIIPLSSVLAIV